MQAKIKLYSKGTRQLPVYVDERDVTNAVVLDQHPMHDESLDESEFLDLSVPSIELTLDESRLSSDVKNWLKKDVLNEYIVGLYFANDEEEFNGYLNAESVEINKNSRDYYITAIGWWKYFYEVVGAEYCPGYGLYSGEMSLEAFLRICFLGEIITEVECLVDNTYYGKRPFINIANYQIYAPLMTIREMLDNYHKALCGVFTIRGSKLYFLQYHKTLGAAKNLNNYMIRSLNGNEVARAERIINFTSYDAVAVQEYGCTYIRRMENGKLVTSYADVNLEPKRYDWKILDLRQTLKSLNDTINGSVDCAFIDEHNITVSKGNITDVDYVDVPPNNDWVGKGIGVLYSGTIWRAIIKDYNGNVITVSDWGRSVGSSTVKPKAGDNVMGIIAEVVDFAAVQSTLFNSTFGNDFELITNALIISVQQTPAAGIVKVAKAINIPKEGFEHPYLNETIMYKLFNPKSSFLLSANTASINAMDEAILDGENLKVIRVSKDCYDLVSELELEEID